jgi:hypothetical protein
MITVTVDQPSQKASPDFPILMRDKKGAAIVLFTNCTTGTVIREGALNVVGEHSRNWAPTGDLTVWEMLPRGTKITLEQQ